jgi:hypothetical protein
VVGGPVTRQAVRLRILFRNAPPIDIAPLDVGPQFAVKFYAVFYLQPAKTAWMPERVVAYDKADHEIAECTPATSQGNVCPPKAPPSRDTGTLPSVTTLAARYRLAPRPPDPGHPRLPSGSGAAAPGGALRTIDASARPRPGPAFGRLEIAAEGGAGRVAT